jgi:hypothetical protein
MVVAGAPRNDPPWINVRRVEALADLGARVEIYEDTVAGLIDSDVVGGDVVLGGVRRVSSHRNAINQSKKATKTHT